MAITATQTTALGFTADAGLHLLDWAEKGFPSPWPNTDLLIAGALAVHWTCVIVAAAFPGFAARFSQASQQQH